MKNKKSTIIGLILFSLFVAFFSWGQGSLWTIHKTVSTAKRDSTFNPSWESAAIWVTGCDMYLQIANAGDTAGISTRDSLLLAEEAIMHIGPDSKLRTIRWWAPSGSGNMFIAGVRKLDH